jgi:hypothetical protein
MKTKYNAYIPLLFALLSLGCKKIISVGVPDSQLVSASMFQDSLTAQSAMGGLYSQMYNGSGTGASFYSSPITVDPARSADEMIDVQTTTDDFQNNRLLPSDADLNTLWSGSYNLIYTANSILEGVAGSPLSPTLSRQLSGEAKFIRALNYFYLVNYFGDVPLVTTTSVQTNEKLGRAASSLIYQLIEGDLAAARDSLSTDYSWSQGDRTRANKWAAEALLARVYLYEGKWAQAETEASNVIANTALYALVPNPANAFLKNSNEAIFQFYTNVTGYTWLASQVYLTGHALPTIELDTILVRAFEPNDARYGAWVSTVNYQGASYPFEYKYKSYTSGANTEYDMVLRLAEQYLIRAEARAHQNNIPGD